MNAPNYPTSDPAASPTSSATGGNPPSVEEVRELIGSLSTRTCEEAIGLGQQGGLVTGIVQATLGFAAVLFVLTAIPYWIGSNESAPAPGTASNTVVADENSVAPPVAPATPEAGADNDVDLSQAADVLGIDETKSASPDENPLENKLDNLLDGVD